MRYTLSKFEIIRGRKKFQEILSSKNKLIEKNILCFYEIEKNTNEKEKVLVGFIVGKKIGKAVLRNRIKRLMRESYRLNKNIILDTISQSNYKISLIFVFTQADINLEKIKFVVVEQGIVQLLQRVKAILTKTQP